MAHSGLSLLAIEAALTNLIVSDVLYDSGLLLMSKLHQKMSRKL